MGPLSFTNAALSVFRGTYRDIPCIFVRMTQSSQGWVLFTSANHVESMASEARNLVGLEHLEHFSAFTGTIQRGFVDSPEYGAHRRQGIVAIPSDSSAWGRCFFPKGRYHYYQGEQKNLVIGKVPRNKVKRKDLLAQLQTANHDLATVSGLAAERLNEIASLNEALKNEQDAHRVTNNQLIDTAAVAQGYKDERDALQRQVDLLSTRIDPATEGLLRDHRNTLRQALSLLVFQVGTLSQDLPIVAGYNAAVKALEQTS